MLICQISDLHVRAPGELAYRRVDTAAFIRRCVSHILAERPLPDVVVVTGDLVDRGQPDEYRHLAALLGPLSMPFYLIPGNHDERSSLRNAFPGHRYLNTGGEFLHYVVSLGPLQLLGLDTVVPGEGGGLLCTDRLRWLEARLDELHGSPVVVLMHHPPFVTGISHMDRVGLDVAYPLEPDTCIERSSGVSAERLPPLPQVRRTRLCSISCPMPRPSSRWNRRDTSCIDGMNEKVRPAMV